VTGRVKPRILCLSVSFSRLAQMCAALPAGLYQVLSASSPAHAVAACANNKIAAVVLDSEFLTDGGITLPQTFKALNPNLPIVLLELGHNGDIPEAVDAVATTSKMMLKKLAVLIKSSG
jgi:DNA-binding NtrC family response regulator